MEEQAFWKDIAVLIKELRYKLEQYRKKETNGGIFQTGYCIGQVYFLAFQHKLAYNNLTN